MLPRHSRTLSPGASPTQRAGYDVAGIQRLYQHRVSIGSLDARQKHSGMTETALDQPQLAGAGDGLGAAAHVELAVDIVDVGLDGAGGDDQLRGDFGVG